MHIYYFFSVNDFFFTSVTKEFLNEHSGEVTFSGIANGRRDFLETAPYTNVSYLSELDYEKEAIDYEYLTEVEKKYDIRIAELIYMERHFWRLPKLQRVRYAQLIIKAIEHDYQDNPFDVVFSEGLADFTSYFLWCFCKARGIPFYYFVFARMGDFVFLSNRSDTGPINLESIFKKHVKDYNNESVEVFKSTKAYIQDYIDKKQQPYYVSNSDMLFKIFSANDVKRFIKSLGNYMQDTNSFHAYKNPVLFPFQRMKKIVNKVAYNRNFKEFFLTQDDLKEKKYFVYPLHFHPEAATLIQGRWLHNQQQIIEMISRVLPADVFLIVKEHKVSVGRRPLAFYKAINEVHNVHFVSELYDVYQLIKKSLGVVTISSSMGLEAVMLKKPVITFGDIHYNILSGVIKARDISKMQEYVDRALQFKGYNEAEYWAFFKTILQGTWSMPGYSPHDFNPTHVERVCNMLKIIIDK